MSQAITDNGGVPDPSKGAVLSGNKMTIELSKALIRYDAFTSPVLTEVKLVVAYYQGIANLIDKAYLQISSVPPEFFPATSITITPPSSPVAMSNIPLTASITPSGTTVQLVTWEIVSGGTLKAPKEVDFVINQPIGPVITKSKDTIYVDNPNGGSVKVRATLKGGGVDKKDVTAELLIDVGFNPFPNITGATKIGYTASNGNQGIFDFKSAVAASPTSKYFIILSYNSPKVGTGEQFGGIQLQLQGDGVTNLQQKTGDGTRIPTMDSNKFVYFVFDLTKWSNYDDWIASASKDYTQIMLTWGAGELGTFQGYLVSGSTTITTPTEGGSVVVMPYESVSHPQGLNWGAGDPIGYLTNQIPGGLSF